MKHTFSASLLAAALLLTLSVPVTAFSEKTGMSMKEHRERHGPMMDTGMMDRMGDMMGMCIEHADDMGLTEDQIMRIKPIHSEMRKQQARFKADLKIAEIDLMAVMEVKDFDIDKATSISNKIVDIKKAHHFEMLRAMKDIRSILTNEQFKEMKKMMAMRMDD